MAGQLTALAIGKLKTPGKYYDHTHGLFLQVYPSGAKCWQQRLTDAPGHRCTVGLGGYPTVGLAEARVAACKNWLLLQDGGDPRPSKRASPTAIPTFEEAAAAVIEENAPTWTDPKHPKDWAILWPATYSRVSVRSWCLRLTLITCSKRSNPSGTRVRRRLDVCASAFVRFWPGRSLSSIAPTTRPARPSTACFRRGVRVSIRSSTTLRFRTVNCRNS